MKLRITVPEKERTKRLPTKPVLDFFKQLGETMVIRTLRSLLDMNKPTKLRITFAEFRYLFPAWRRQVALYEASPARLGESPRVF